MKMWQEANTEFIHKNSEQNGQKCDKKQTQNLFTKTVNKMDENVARNKHGIYSQKQTQKSTTCLMKWESHLGHAKMYSHKT